MKWTVWILVVFGVSTFAKVEEMNLQQESQAIAQNEPGPVVTDGGDDGGESSGGVESADDEDSINQFPPFGGCVACPFRPFGPCPCPFPGQCRLIPRTCFSCPRWVCQRIFPPFPAPFPRPFPVPFPRPFPERGEPFPERGGRH